MLVGVKFRVIVTCVTKLRLSQAKCTSQSRIISEQRNRDIRQGSGRGQIGSDQQMLS
jgi:hypothetical protein